jgi:hypothetical protein
MTVFIIALIILAIWIYNNQKPKEVKERADYIPTDDNLDLIQSEFLFYLNEHSESLGLKPLILVGTNTKNICSDNFKI